MKSRSVSTLSWKGRCFVKNHLFEIVFIFTYYFSHTTPLIWTSREKGGYWSVVRNHFSLEKLFIAHNLMSILRYIYFCKSLFVHNSFHINLTQKRTIFYDHIWKIIYFFEKSLNLNFKRKMTIFCDHLFLLKSFLILKIVFRS